MTKYICEDICSNKDKNKMHLCCLDCEEIPKCEWRCAEFELCGINSAEKCNLAKEEKE